MDVHLLDVVKSNAGRDKGKWFVVVGSDAEYLYLADGKRRRVLSPKKKKRRHVRAAERQLSPWTGGSSPTDGDIRRRLALFRKEAEAQTGEPEAQGDR